LLDSAVTDADGRARLAAPADGEPVFVRATAPAHVAKVHGPLVVSATGQPVLIEVESSATLRVQMTPASYVEALQGLPPKRLPEVSLGSRDGSLRLPRLTGSSRLANDGSFERSDIPAGTWELLVDGVNVATVELRAGQRTEVTVDAARIARCQLTGIVLADGEPLREVIIALHGREHHTDGAGRFVAKDFRPGLVSAQLVRNLDERCGYSFDLGETVTLPPGGDVHKVFDFKARPVRLRLLDPDGRPVPPMAVQLATTPPLVRGWAQGITDGDGWLAWPALPHGTSSLWVHTTTQTMAGGSEKWRALATELESLVVVPGRGVQVFERRLPAK
jgi:hypothetical protein